VGDAENPGRQASGRVEGRETAKRFDEGLLSKILRQRSVAREPDEQRQDGALVAADNLLERTLGAPKRLSYQPRLGYAIKIDLDRSSLATGSYLRLRKDVTARCRRIWYLYLYPEPFTLSPEP